MYEFIHFVDFSLIFIACIMLLAYLIFVALERRHVVCFSCQEKMKASELKELAIQETREKKRVARKKRGFELQ